ncbi:MAG: DNA translocase FtsK, partial [Negativicoccus succinicivorans]|nr:DNA translocase FtsK [Negativicoccus succinicivorans]
HVETTPTEQKQRAQFFSFDKSKEKPPVNDAPAPERTTKAAAVTPFTPSAAAPAAAPEPSWTQPEPDTDTEQVKPDIAPAKPKNDRADYKLPPLSLLTKTRQSTADTQAEVAENAQKLEELLASFGVETKITHASRGPSVTRYELEPGPGVKVSKIVNLADDIALQLAATDVRIEAPIPGKAAVGIEVPNREISSVGLREVLVCDEFQHAVGGIAVGLGEDITGQPVITDLAKMPHLLVAGSTGSGKSVCINTLVASILLRSYPDEVKLILIDPKVVELAQYNHIPHLLTPVVTDVKKAAGVLRWAVREMENRYRLFASAKVRNITSYNEANPDSPLPLVVIIIDELADLMMVAPHDVEDAIARLAQMARAAGLHLVLATQRPSVDVLTGTIKANIPSRISFAVSSQIDSRTILDMAGAEKLLGKGDMLFYPIGAPKPRRVQGAFISDADVEKLVEYIKKQGQPEYNETVVQPAAEAEETQTPRWEDELLPDAIRMVMDTEQASVSMLQRRFRVGYTRAGRLIDTMENMGIVGPSLGSKARDILLTKDEVEELLARYEGDSEA